MDDPCAILAAERLAANELSVENRTSTSGTTGPACMWTLSEGGGGFSATLISLNKEGLSSVYAKEQRGEWEYFEATNVNGHPAAVALQVDGRADGFCSLDVGVRDETDLLITVEAPSKFSPLRKDPCGSAKKIAAMAIQTMTGK